MREKLGALGLWLNENPLLLQLGSSQNGGV